jgi:hypothetical protein
VSHTEELAGSVYRSVEQLANRLISECTDQAEIRHITRLASDAKDAILAMIPDEMAPESDGGEPPDELPDAADDDQGEEYETVDVPEETPPLPRPEPETQPASAQGFPNRGYAAPANR